MRPDVATVGLGRVRAMLEVVWVISNVVATSTVVAALPMVLLDVWLDMATALSKVELALVNVEPVATVSPPLNVPSPVNVLVPVTASVPPRVVAPVPTLRVLVPVMLVLPFRVVTPVTVRVPPTVALLVTPSVPMVAVPPMLALLVTDRAVPALLNVLAAVKVLAWFR